jgi:hypothetical protein
MDHLKSDDNTKFKGNLQPHNGILPKQPKAIGPGQYPGANSSSFGAQVFSNHKNLQTYSFGLPDNRSKNAKKHPETKRFKTPGPGAYPNALTPSVGAQSLSTRPGSARFSFGTAARNAGSPLKKFAVKGSHTPRSPRDTVSAGAGPGAYRPMNGIGPQVLSPRRTLPSYSFGPSAGASWKSLRFRKNKDASDLPGPGQYVRNDTSIGPQIYTDMRTSAAYGFGTGRRYPRPKTSMPGYRPIPGPGAYSNIPGSFGDQTLSKFRSLPRTKFGSSQRIDVAKAAAQGPGPGAYNGRIESFGSNPFIKKSPSFGFGTLRRMRYNAVVMK